MHTGVFVLPQDTNFEGVLLNGIHLCGVKNALCIVGTGWETGHRQDCAMGCDYWDVIHTLGTAGMAFRAFRRHDEVYFIVAGRRL